MNYKIRAFNCGTFRVPGPEVYWMHKWGQREEMRASRGPDRTEYRLARFLRI